MVTETEEKLSSSNYVYYLQLSAWSEEKDAILSKIDLVKVENPFIEKFDKNGVSFGGSDLVHSNHMKMLKKSLMI